MRARDPREGGGGALRRHARVGRLRDLAGSEAAYREAIRRHPGAADAWNNLAQTLHELRQHDEAPAAAQRAVDIGGPRLAQYRATLQAITEAR